MEFTTDAKIEELLMSLREEATARFPGCRSLHVVPAAMPSGVKWTVAAFPGDKYNPAAMGTVYSYSDALAQAEREAAGWTPKVTP